MRVLTAFLLMIFVVASSPAQAGKKGGLLGAILGAAASGAASSAVSAATKNDSYGSSHLSPENLKACLISAHNNDELGIVLDKQSAAIDVLDVEVERLSAILVRDQDTEFDTQAEVDRYNATYDEYQSGFERYNRDVDAFNLAVEKHAADVELFNLACGEKQFYSDDLASIASDLPFDTDSYTAD